MHREERRARSAAAHDGSSALSTVDVRSPADVERLVAFSRALLERTRQLEHALASRIVIEQAKGVLAERWRVSPDDAFEVLRRAARNRRIRIHDLAADVVASPETPEALVEARSP